MGIERSVGEGRGMDLPGGRDRKTPSTLSFSRNQAGFQKTFVDVSSDVYRLCASVKRRPFVAGVY